MAHHHHQCCCCCCSSSYRNPPPTPPPPPSISATDSALLTIAAYLASALHNQPLIAPPPPVPPSQIDTQSIQPLLHRLSTLETTLQHISLGRSPSPSASSPTHVRTHSHPPQPKLRQVSARGRGLHSLREHAARSIQAHFRSFLVRRSQTLRHLKLIAFAQTFLNNLRSRLGDRTQLLLLCGKSEARHHLAEKTADLLAKIDAIRGGDSMIREAKRSVSRDLVGVLDVLEGPSCRNDITTNWVAGESNGGQEEIRDSRALGKAQNRFTVRRGDLESVETGNGPESYPYIVGNVGTECKGRHCDDGQDPETVVEILEIDDGGCYSGEKSQKEGEFRNGFIGLQCGGGNSGLSAPLPLQMEARSGDLAKET